METNIESYAWSNIESYTWSNIESYAGSDFQSYVPTYTGTINGSNSSTDNCNCPSCS